MGTSPGAVPPLLCKHDGECSFMPVFPSNPSSSEQFSHFLVLGNNRPERINYKEHICVIISVLDEIIRLKLYIDAC